MNQSPPYETFTRSVCKGSIAIGTGCGKCEKCQWEIAQGAVRIKPFSDMRTASQSEDQLRSIASIVRSAGARRQSDAGYGGRMDDGGGGALIAQADAFLAGLDRRLPSGWESYAAQAEKSVDPEYAELQRLKRKFGE